MRLIMCAAFCLAAMPAVAQSVITLEDFDLGPSAPDAAPQVTQDVSSSMKDCLRDPTKCENGGFKSNVTFTLDDVVNLGIIDREDVAVQRASTGQPVSAEPQALPSIDLEVLFDRNSDAIRSDQMGQLIELANVLRGDDFGRYRLIFMGHTDAKGSVEYNLALSHRRAQSVAEFVALSANVPRSRIESVGLGFSRLADPLNPLAQSNRRVQLVLVPQS